MTNRKTDCAGPGAGPSFWLLICGAVALAFGVLWWQGATSGIAFNYNEGVYLCSTRMVLNGHRLYRDVFCSQPPLLVEVLAMVFRVVGDRLETARGLMVLCSVCSLACVARIAWFAFGRPAVLLAMIAYGLAASVAWGAATCQAEPLA